jgi:hypothetical protein
MLWHLGVMKFLVKEVLTTDLLPGRKELVVVENSLVICRRTTLKSLTKFLWLSPRKSSESQLPCRQKCLQR